MKQCKEENVRATFVNKVKVAGLLVCLALTGWGFLVLSSFNHAYAQQDTEQGSAPIINQANTSAEETLPPQDLETTITQPPSNHSFELKLDQNFSSPAMVAPPFLLPNTEDPRVETDSVFGIERLIDSPLSTRLNPLPKVPTEQAKQTLFDLSMESLEQEQPPKTQTGQILVLKVIDYRDDQFLKIDSSSRIKLNPTLQSAIDHHIDLYFTIQMRLMEDNRLLGIPYQRSRKSIDYHVKLSIEEIEQRYSLVNSRNGQKQFFNDLDKALETLSTIQAFDIAQLNELHPKQTYRLQIRIYIDRWKLPAPLLLQALFTDEWTLDSGWFETTLEAPQSWQ